MRVSINCLHLIVNVKRNYESGGHEIEKKAEQRSLTINQAASASAGIEVRLEVGFGTTECRGSKGLWPSDLAQIDLISVCIKFTFFLHWQDWNVTG